MNKKIKTIFTLSVLLNIFLIGLVVGGVSKGLDREFRDREFRDREFRDREPKRDFPHEVRIKNRAERELNDLAEMLPESERESFKSNFKKLSEENEEIRQKTGEIRREIANIFKTEPFNEELFYQKTQEMHDLRGKQMMESSAIIGQMAAHLSLEQRKKLNQRFSLGRRQAIKSFDDQRRP